MNVSTRAARAAAALLFGPLAFVTGAARAEPPRLVAIDARQMQAAGIETQTLGPAGAATSLKFPARVVVPNAQIHVVAAPLDGLVETLTVAPNDTVRRGQILARLQSPRLLEAQRQFLQAATQAQLAQTGFRRDEQLFKEGIIAEGRYQATKANHIQAAAALSERRQVLRLYGMSDGAIQALQSGKGMSSTLDIVAPISGVVLEQMAATGQRAEAAAPLYKVARLDPLWLEIQATPAAAAGIAPGAAVSVGVASGQVLSVGRHLDAATQTVMIRAEITRRAERLRPGQYVEAQVAGSAGDAKQWQVSTAALARLQGRTYVFVQTKNGFVATEVRLLSETPTVSTIAEATPGSLGGGERIAVKGISALKAIWTGVGGGE